MKKTKDTSEQKAESDANQPTIAIIGGGLSGLATALAIGDAFDTAASPDFDPQILLFAPLPPKPDGRTTAIMAKNIELLEKLGLWASVCDQAAPLSVMRIIDDTGSLVRAPETRFRASEIGLEAFAFNVSNAALTKVMHAQISTRRRICLIERPVADPKSQTESSRTVHTLSDGKKTYTADFLIAADGRNSMIRQALGITTRNWQYDQIALVANLRHTIPHYDISTEFHTRTGPCTFVPLKAGNTPSSENHSSLVCVVDPASAERLKSLEPKALALEIEKRSHAILGKIELTAPLQSFALSGMIAHRLAGENAVLIGEAAHVMPPIGSQGFNLGLRDVQTIASLLGQIRNCDELGQLGARYEQQRRGDVTSRMAAVDMLNRSLLSQFLPLQAARSLGLAAIGSVPPLRKLVMCEGVAPLQGMSAMLEAINPFNRFARSNQSQPTRNK